MGFFSKLFKTKDEVDFATLLQNGATLLDVRTISEYKLGHAKNSINIPLDELSGKLSNLDKSKSIITVCQRGMRSRSAASILRNNGFENVYNGGCWANFE